MEKGKKKIKVVRFVRFVRLHGDIMYTWEPGKRKYTHDKTLWIFVGTPYGKRPKGLFSFIGKLGKETPYKRRGGSTGVKKGKYGRI